MRRFHHALFATQVTLFAWALASGCAGAAPPRLGAPQALPSPAAPGSGEPRLALSPDGAVLMTWIEPVESGGHALRFARLEGDTWSAPATVAAGDSFFVNWADFPALVAIDGTRLAVSYPWKSGAGPYAYDVFIRFSEDGGATWGPPVRPHTDGTATEHGFVTLLAETHAVRAIWLDGRNMAGHDEAEGAGPPMTLRTARIGTDGTIADEALLDPRTCDCCQTAGAVTAGGTLIAYRDRSEDEVRDVAMVRSAGGAWSDPAPVHADGWAIAGCPVNGPAMAAAGDATAIAWYTAARDTAVVLAAFAGPGGDFGAPVRVDGGDPLGRTAIALLDDGSAVVSWMETAADTAEIRLRRVTARGTLGDPVVLTRNSPRRSSGFPQLVRAGRRLVSAWTEPGSPSQVRVAEVPLQ